MQMEANEGQTNLKKTGQMQRHQVTQKAQDGCEDAERVAKEPGLRRSAPLAKEVDSDNQDDTDTDSAAMLHDESDEDLTDDLNMEADIPLQASTVAIDQFRAYVSNAKQDFLWLDSDEVASTTLMHTLLKKRLL